MAVERIQFGHSCNYPIGLLPSLGFRGRVTSLHVGNMFFSSSMVTSRPKPVTYSFSGSLDDVSAGVTNVTMLWPPTKSTSRSTPRTFFAFNSSTCLTAVSWSAKLMTAYLYDNTCTTIISISLWRVMDCLQTVKTDSYNYKQCKKMHHFALSSLCTAKQNDVFLHCLYESMQVYSRLARSLHIVKYYLCQSLLILINKCKQINAIQLSTNNPTSNETTSVCSFSLRCQTCHWTHCKI